jgi:hypothetical protein
MTQAEVSSWFKHKALRYIYDNPGKTARLLVTKTALFWGPAEISNNKEIALERDFSRILGILPLSFPILLALAVVGTVLMLGQRTGPAVKTAAVFHGRNGEMRSAIIVLFVLFLLTWFLSYLPFFVCARYRVPMIPVLVMLASCGLVEIAALVRERNMKRLGLIAVGGVALIYVATRSPIEVEPNLAAWHMDRGRAYRLSGDHLHALEEFQRAVDASPEYGKPHFELANVLQVVGRLGEAQVHYEEALKFGYEPFEVENNRGLMYARQGDHDRAIASFRAALERNPGSDMVHFNLGLAYEQGSRYELAAEHYRQALRLEPRLTRARHALDRVQELIRRNAPATPSQR